MKEVAAAVEDDQGDAVGLCALGDGLSDDGGALGLVLAFELGGEGLIGIACGGKGVARDVIDDLGVDVLGAAEYVEARAHGGAGDGFAHAGVAALTTDQVAALNTSQISAVTTAGIAAMTTAQVAAILFEGKAPKQAVADLMERTLKAEQWR